MLRPLNFRQLTSAKNNIGQEAWEEEEAVSAFGHGLPSKKMGNDKSLMTRKCADAIIHFEWKTYSALVNVSMARNYSRPPTNI